MRPSATPPHSNVACPTARYTLLSIMRILFLCVFFFFASLWSGRSVGGQLGGRGYWAGRWGSCAFAFEVALDCIKVTIATII